MTSKHLDRVLATVFIMLAGPAVAADLPTAAPHAIGELSALVLPSDVAVGRGGQVYVVNGGQHEIAVYDASGRKVDALGTLGNDAGQLMMPLALGVGPGGEVYVVDRGNNRIVPFDAEGNPLRPLVLEEDDEEIVPVDVAVSKDGAELFVTTNNTHRVVVFSNRGEYLRGWGGEGEEDGRFRFPATIDVDAAGNVYVVDVLNARVQKFDPDGTHRLTIGERGGRAGTFFRPKGVAVDGTGRVFVSDSYLGVVQAFDVAGTFLYAIGDDGTAAVFDTPAGLSAAGGRLYVTQMLAGKVAVLEPQAPPAAPKEGE